MKTATLQAMIAIAAIPLIAAADAARDQRVRQDLAYAADQIVAHHPNPFTRISRDEFAARRQAVSDAIPSLDDVAAYLRIKALVASIGDAHTSLAVDTRFYQSLGILDFPVRATLYDDGLFLSSTDEAHRGRLGWRVVSINGRTPADLLEAIRPVIYSTTSGRLGNSSLR